MRTNEERALEILEDHTVIASWRDDNRRRITVNGVCLTRDIAEALDKAERRGRRKERKRKPVQRKTIHCPACGRLIALVPLPEMNREPAPQFDAEKISDLITELLSTQYMLAKADMWHACKERTTRDDAHNALLTALGITE